MRDKGRAVLEALGWRVEKTTEITGDDRVEDGWYLVFNYKRYSTWKPSEELAWKAMPNLSDPGVFWPLFRKWCRQNAHSYMSRWQWSYKDLMSLTLMDDGKEPGKVIHGEGESETEAGINAWYSALSALGKIREG